MTYRFLGPDPLEAQIDAVLRKIADGSAPRDIEVAAVEVKEEPGRRGPGGAVPARRAGKRVRCSVPRR